MTETRSYRRLLYVWVGLLCLGVFVQALLAAFLVHETNARQQEDLELARQALALTRQNTTTIRQLCDRGYLIADLILAAEDLVKAQKPLPRETKVFLRQFELSYNQVLDEVTRPGSPCVR